MNWTKETKKDVCRGSVKQEVVEAKQTDNIISNKRPKRKGQKRSGQKKTEQETMIVHHHYP